MFYFGLFLNERIGGKTKKQNAQSRFGKIKNILKKVKKIACEEFKEDIKEIKGIFGNGRNGIKD